MKMKIAEVQKITQRLNLEMPPLYEFALFNYPVIVDELANGVGSETAWYYHLIPDTVWLLNINPASHIHDWEYSLPYEFATQAAGEAYFHEVNMRFLRNCQKLTSDASAILRPLRDHRCKLYYKAVESADGELAFWAHKSLPSDFNASYQDRLDLDIKVLMRYQEIQSFLANKIQSKGASRI